MTRPVPDELVDRGAEQLAETGGNRECREEAQKDERRAEREQPARPGSGGVRRENPARREEQEDRRREEERAGEREGARGPRRRTRNPRGAEKEDANSLEHRDGASAPGRRAGQSEERRNHSRREPEHPRENESVGGDRVERLEESGGNLGLDVAGEERGLRRREPRGSHGPDGSEENVQRERIGGGAAPREYGKRPAREREDTGQLQCSREQGEKAADRPRRQRLSDRAQEGAASDADEHREEHRAGRRRGPEDARDGLERDPEDEKTGEADELDVRVDLKMRR